MKERRGAEQRFNDAHEAVKCQRFFGSRHGLYYIRVLNVQQPEDDERPTDVW
jgi:hypothetical protein